MLSDDIAAVSANDDTFRIFGKWIIIGFVSCNSELAIDTMPLVGSAWNESIISSAFHLIRRYDWIGD